MARDTPDNQHRVAGPGELLSDPPIVCRRCFELDLEHDENCPEHEDYSGPERWLAVVGYEGLYEVSSFGRVRSLDRPALGGSGFHARPGKVLSPGPRGLYLSVLLYNRTGSRVQRSVHALVLEAFAGPRPLGMQGSHLDGDTTNNAESNLEWATPKQNNAEKIRHGTQLRGEQHHASYLSENDVKQIRALRVEGHSQRRICKIIGCSQTQVRNILSGHSWSHMSEKE